MAQEGKDLFLGPFWTAQEGSILCLDLWGGEMGQVRERCEDIIKEGLCTVLPCPGHVCRCATYMSPVDPFSTPLPVQGGQAGVTKM